MNSVYNSSIRDVFIVKRYPEKLVKDTLEKSWEVETLKEVLVGVQQEVKAENQKEHFDVLHHLCSRFFGELAKDINEVPGWVCSKERGNSSHKAVQANTNSET